MKCDPLSAHVTYHIHNHHGLHNEFYFQINEKTRTTMHDEILFHTKAQQWEIMKHWHLPVEAAT